MQHFIGASHAIGIHLESSNRSPFFRTQDRAIPRSSTSLPGSFEMGCHHAIPPILPIFLVGKGSVVPVALEKAAI